jgi:hypothetical protein
MSGAWWPGAGLFPLLRYRTVRLFECVREAKAPSSQIG